MSKTFRAWKIDEPLFLPPTVQDFVAEDHLARFVLSLVRDDLDLIEISGTYCSERGQPPFDPTMMTALLLYSYCCGIYSSRRISKACRERVDFMSIVALGGLRSAVSADVLNFLLSLDVGTLTNHEKRAHLIDLRREHL